MKNYTRVERTISQLLLLYFAILFFYGVIIKYTFHNSFLFELKTYIPEMLLALVCINCLKKRITININSLIMVAVIALILVLNIFTSFTTASFLMTFRDVFVPLITGTFLCSIDITSKEKEWFFKKLSILCKVSLVCGIVLGLFQFVNGWQWTSSWYTGYSFWGEDSVSSLYIMNSGLRVRVPSIVGHNVKFGMYSLFQYLIIVFFDKTNINSKKIVFAIIMLCNVYISNNKTTMVIALLLIVIWLMNKFNSHSKIIIFGCILISGAYIYFELLSSSEFMLSFYDRFSKWSALKEPKLLRNIIFPVSTYNFAGNSAIDIPVLNYWDNTYLYFLFSYGAVGSIVVLKWLRNIYKKAKKNISFVDEKFVLYMTVFASVAACTTSIVLGRCFFNIYVIIISYLVVLKKAGRE